MSDRGSNGETKITCGRARWDNRSGIGGTPLPKGVVRETKSLYYIHRSAFKGSFHVLVRYTVSFLSEYILMFNQVPTVFSLHPTCIVH